MQRISDNMKELEIKQAKVIDVLQEKLKLKDYDISQYKKKICLLKKKINSTNYVLNNILEILQEMQFNKDLSKLHTVVLMLIGTTKKGITKNEK